MSQARTYKNNNYICEDDDYWIGRFGQTANGDFDTFGPTFEDWLYGHKALETPTSYKEVIAYLENIFKDAPPGREIIVSHPSNPYYKDHNGWTGSCRDNIYAAIAFVKFRREQEKNNKLRQVGRKLNELYSNIIRFEKIGGNSEIIEALKSLYEHLNADILADRCYKPGENSWEDEEPEYNGPDLNKTNYPLIIDHFIMLTRQFIHHPNSIVTDKIKESERELEKKLNGQPISTRLRAAISGVFGTILGLGVGALIGGIMTVGIGIIPGAIIGATLGGSSSSLFGFFHAKRHNEVINSRKQPFQVIDDDGKRTAEPEKYAHETYNQIEFSLKK